VVTLLHARVSFLLAAHSAFFLRYARELKSGSFLSCFHRGHFVACTRFFFACCTFSIFFLRYARELKSGSFLSCFHR
jgi:hypothetical protein